MKFTTIASSLALAFLSVTSAHMAISNPPGQAGPWSTDPQDNVHAWIGYEGKPFPCGGYKKGPVTTYKAGEVIPVRFWNFEVTDYTKFPPPAGLSQARHGGGACEFSLSYDGGKTFHVIGQYTKTCPDLYYEWPVTIPANAPACTDSDMCLFAFSWTAYNVDQFYHHCANVMIEAADNTEQKNLPELTMTVVDVAQLGEKVDMHAAGDTLNTKSTGPNKTEQALNENGYFFCGGGAGKHGLDLGLALP
ncbi:hypothetical protein EMPS_06971 [Entomortierella parvispora]|uniref:Chitin-binding type-4 domain-containing protein n=1 Tax=Entomortierella parvispora TaxID=205924 RepID=A0A9P3HE07_9FUNG|nr:hypothetical protein EMPS_06971 [Entomortierella parvispora]